MQKKIYFCLHLLTTSYFYTYLYIKMFYELHLFVH